MRKMGGTLLIGVGGLVFALGASSVVVGGFRSCARESMFSVDPKTHKTYDYEGRELDASGKPKEWSTWRRFVAALVPQAGYTSAGWLDWLMFFAGMGVAYAGSSTIRRGLDLRRRQGTGG